MGNSGCIERLPACVKGLVGLGGGVNAQQITLKKEHKV